MRVTLLTVTAVLFSAHLASASIELDFAAAAEGNERGYGFGDSIQVSGQTVKLYAWNTIESPLTNQSLDSATFAPGGSVTIGTATKDGPFAYMDDDEAGLGATQALNKGLDAVPSSEDDVGAAGDIEGGREVVGIQLMFDAVGVTQLKFRDKHHDPLPAGTLIDITFDNGDTWTQYSIGGSGILDLAVEYDSDDKIGFGYVDTPFYLSSVSVAVPEPMTLFVWVGLFSAIGGVIGHRRRAQ